MTIRLCADTLPRLAAHDRAAPTPGIVHLRAGNPCRADRVEGERSAASPATLWRQRAGAVLQRHADGALCPRA